MELYDCIKRIPTRLDNILNNYHDLKKQVLDFIQEKEIKEIVFIGSGTSMNACKVTRYFSENECKIHVHFYYPNEFMNYFNYFNKDALYVFVSQGGATKLVYDSLLKAKEHECMTCSITEKLDAPIALQADLSLDMGSIKEEYIYRTIGYSTTACTITLLETILSKNEELEESVLEDLKKCISNLDYIRECTDNWYVKNKFSLMRRNKVIFAGAQSFYEVANEADIKIMEMVPLMTRSFELEELIHGPQNAFDDNTIFFLLSNNKIDSDKVRRIANYLKNEIGFCAIVGNQSIDYKDLMIPLKSNYYTFLEEITPFQVIAYKMAIDHGRDLTRKVNGNMDKYITKIL